nr:glycosyltransferase [uncultured Bacteroides sp.]
MKILFLPNWHINYLNKDDPSIQDPDKYVNGEKYWFFKYFPDDTTVDIIDIKCNNPLHKIEIKTKFYIWQAFLAFFKLRKYDIVISHGAQSGIVLSFLRTVTFMQTPKHIIFDIGGMNGAKAKGLSTKLISFAMKSSPYIICHSKIILSNLKNIYPNLLPKALFIPFGVDVDYFKPQIKERKSNYVFSFGYSKRDYETLINAWKLIDTTCELRIAGIHSMQASEEISNINLIGKISISQLKEEIQNSLFVVIPLPKYNYSYGQMSFLQSMSLGKTVIVSSVPSSIDYIIDNEGAFLVEPYNVEDLKNKIEILLSNPKLLENSDLKARKFVLEHFNQLNMGIQIRNFIINIVNS